MLERLKIEARKENRSLNNYVESVLLDAVYREPNEETLAAMKEAKEGKDLTKVDTSSLESFLKSLNESCSSSLTDGEMQQMRRSTGSTVERCVLQVAT